MKRCPSCERTYTDDALSFCPNDGTPLVTDAPPSSFDPQATIMASPPKVNAPSGPFGQPPSDWPSQPPAAQNDWSAPPPAPQQQTGWGDTPGSYQPGSQVMGGTGWQAPPPPPFPGAGGGQQKTLAIASLVLGILSLVCLGIITGPVAIILGVMALNKEKNEPAIYGGGKGMAYAGIALGAISVVLTLLFILIALAGGFR
ncbi:MAG: DUF4190 domain-containing protein [Pyrinomonadaceae bacterium]|nr:DUF4190 domain-containing protein [Pyrinomonadaceae bacterium]